MNRPGTRTVGFTLVELLVGMALMGIILLALTNFFSQSGRISAQSSTRAELQQEVLNAQQLIAGKLKEAWYVYPPGATLSLTGTNLTQNPVTGTNAWNITTTAASNHPMLAMILPPRNPSVACVSPTTAVPDPDGCYRFLAYYPVKRGVWIAGIGADSWRNPGPDPANADAWILAEYRRVMPSTFAPTTFPPATLPAVPTSAVANILADYVAPTVTTTGFTTATNTYTMFTYAAADGNPPSVTNPVSSVTINLAVARQSRGTLLRLPDAADEYGTTVFPANLGRVTAN